MLDEVVLDAWTAKTITDRGRLEEDLALTRERGWALEDAELDLTRRSIGAVVRDHSGVAVAAVGIGHLATRFPDDELPELAEAVIGQATQIIRGPRWGARRPRAPAARHHRDRGGGASCSSGGPDRHAATGGRPRKQTRAA